jgi:pheromone shutdown-related protein TraB
MTEVGNVVHVPIGDRDIYLIGTAHVSLKSVAEVKRVIRELRPDTVCVELDQTRFEAMTDPNRFRRLDVFKVIREKKVLFLLANLVLGSFQKRLGERLGVKPGAELLAGVETAEEVGAELVLADRDIQATLKRSWWNLTLWNRVQLLGVMLGTLFAREEIDEAQVEALKERDTISLIMREFAEHMPRLQVPLIDERDRYLMSAIREAPGKTIVGVVGAGHIEGMLRYRDEPVDRTALSVIPEPGFVTRSLKWVIPAIILLAFYYGYRQHQGEGLLHMLYAWVLPNIVMASLFAALAGAKPLSVLVAGVASPITSLNPTIGAGMVSGLVEAWLRKPTVEDCEGVGDAVASVKGMYRNRFTRVLLVFVATNIGSSLGAWVGGIWVVKLL